VEVTPNDPVRVANVSITLTGMQDQESEFTAQRVRDLWRLAKGDVFRQSAWAEAKSSALAKFVCTRYFGAAIAESQATVDPKEQALVRETVR